MAAGGEQLDNAVDRGGRLGVTADRRPARVGL